MSENQVYLRRPCYAPELKFSEQPGAISGYGSVFGVRDQQGDIVEPGAFAATLAAWQAKGKLPAMLWQHDPNQPIGRWTAMHEDARGLKVSGVLNLNVAKGREVHEMLKAGDIDGLSIGYVSKKHSFRPDRRTRHLAEVHLFEISVVTIASNPDALIGETKQLGSRIELEDLLRAGGLSRGAARKIAAGGWPALQASTSNEDYAARARALAGRIQAATRAIEEKNQ